MAVQITEFGLGHAPALTLDLNPLLPTVPHATKTLPDPPPKKSHLPVPIVEPLAVARNSSTSGTPPALKSPLDETPDDYRPGVASIPLSISTHTPPTSSLVDGSSTLASSTRGERRSSASPPKGLPRATSGGTP